ncbi:hypothetical protein ONS96_014273 [Cadophora gregata f. sp. sojae]|nr:hypothetical protein ONS96_014273 [Cadophora gregata f. sp. sojae]
MPRAALPFPLLLPFQDLARVFLLCHSTGQRSTAQHSTAQRSTAQHSAAQHSTAQRSTAQHSTAQHSAAPGFDYFVTRRSTTPRALNPSPLPSHPSTSDIEPSTLDPHLRSTHQPDLPGLHLTIAHRTPNQARQWSRGFK